MNQMLNVFTVWRQTFLNEMIYYSDGDTENCANSNIHFEYMDALCIELILGQNF